MYAATKRNGELLNNYYCRSFGLSVINLRFFTVYGPWGRPDMAIFKFAEAMMNQKPIPMFTASGRLSLARDFTYVGDIVQGIIGALNYSPKNCNEVFNLGFGQSQKLSKLVRTLEINLGIKAKIVKINYRLFQLILTFSIE